MGDKVLKFVADTFTSNARSFDLYGRWGGEEFIDIMRNVELEELKIIGNRVRSLIENSYIMQNDEKLNVTISIGATIVDKDDTLETLIKRADTLLYESKKAGRNCLTAL